MLNMLDMPYNNYVSNFSYTKIVLLISVHDSKPCMHMSRSMKIK